MAVFFNPPGGPQRHTDGRPFMFGTAQDDTFHFTDGPMFGPGKIVVGGSGSDTFNGGLNAQWDSYYGGHLRGKESGLHTGDATPPYHRDGADTFHIGEMDHVKPSFGRDTIILHGGNYSKRAEVWAQNDGDRIHMAGEERVVRGGFEVDGIRRDSDGEGFTGRIKHVLLRGDTGDYNPATDDQLVLIRGTDPGHYYRADGSNAYRPMMVDFDDREGPTRAEMQSHVDDWALIV